MAKPKVKTNARRLGSSGMSVMEVLIGCLFLLGGGFFFFQSLDAARLKRFSRYRRSLAQHLAINIAEIRASQSDVEASLWIDQWHSTAPFITGIKIQPEGGAEKIQVTYFADPESKREEMLQWFSGEQ